MNILKKRRNHKIETAIGIYESTINKKYIYELTPHNVEINKSEIHGHGVFASKSIGKERWIAKTHHMLPNGDLLRVDFGGLVNHSIDPNCAIQPIACGGVEYWLYSLKPIKKGEELTVDYNKSICKNK